MSNHRRRTTVLPRQYSESNRQHAKTALWRDLFAGGVAGTAGIVAGHPLDTIKVRLQQRQTPTTTKTPTATKTPIANGGNLQNPPTHRSLHRGIGAPLATAALVNASVFCAYGASSRVWDRYYIGATSALESPATAKKQAFCGGVTGVVTSLIVCPVEHVKVRLQAMQIQPGASRSSARSVHRTTSSFSMAKQILTSDYGVRGLYRGLGATILRQAPGMAIYFPTYHTLKDYMGETASDSNNSNPVWWSSALAGGTAGCLSWALIYPLDVIKSRIQCLPMGATLKERSLYCVAGNILRNEGIAQFSRGLGVTLLRAFPVNATIFFVYEFVNRRLLRWDSEFYSLYQNNNGVNQAEEFVC